MRFVLFSVTFLTVGIFYAASHGRLLWPPGRSSIWHHSQFTHFNPPHNYNDNELNCGGFQVQFEQNGGECGVCGDNFQLPRPRPNEGGGFYDRQIIVDSYYTGQEIDVHVQLTANHLGFFEFRLCPHNHPGAPEEKSCFADNLLEIVNGFGEDSTKVAVLKEVMEYPVKVKLPEGLTCSQCVLQWHYLTGNSWGDCGNGTGAIGCGDIQETFRACSDIAIN